MLQLRPTFSESWYRVKNLRARLRPSTQVFRQFYRGQRWYVVRDPAGNQFHRLSDAGYRFIGLLDGRRTVEEAWDLTGGQLADDAPTQPEVINILSQLYAANLIDTDITPDATVLLRRHKQMAKKRMQGRLMNLLFPRIPLWDPDRFLKTWMPIVRIFFSKFGAVLWLAVVVTMIALLTPEWGNIKRAAGNAIAPGNWPFLWLTFVLVKLIHELGHAFACRRFGGECHELGIMFLIFIPTPYVDASSAWSFPSKWSRMFVGAAGMIVEIFFAAIMAFLWLNTIPGVPFYGIPVNELAYNAMLIASVSTVIFNANPLLRYDGYYILSDFLEIPNLRQKSTEYTMGLIKRHFFRLKLTQPLPPPLQRVWLFLYAVCSTIYRIFIGVMIMLLVAYEVPVVGILMAIGGLITWLVVPVVKLFKYLMLEPELHRKRPRAIGFVVATAAAVFILIGLIPFWVHVNAVGVVEASEKSVLYTKTPGFVTRIEAKDGQMIQKGQIILVLNDDELNTKIEELNARLKGLQLRQIQSNAMDPAQKKIDEIEIAAVTQQRDDSLRRREDQTIRSPIDGALIAPNLHELAGGYLARGQEIATVALMDQLRIKATLEQREAELVSRLDRMQPGQASDQEDPATEIRLAGDLETILYGRGTYLINSTQDYLPDEALGQGGGGDIAIDPSDPSGRKPLVNQFQLQVMLSNPDKKYFPGQRAYVRLEIEKRPLIWQWGRRFWQLIQTRSNSRWM